MKKFLLLLLFVPFSCTSDESNSNKITKVAYDLSNISNNSIEAVSKVLGEGKQVGKWTDERAGCVECPKFEYQDGKVEVIYINEKADRITLNEMSELDFDKSVLAALGLPESDPSVANANMMRWDGVQGYREIMAFSNGSNKVDYILVKTNAE